MPTLHWLTREQDIQAAQTVPYRLLEEVPELGHGDPSTGNMLIQGDNLEALKALLPFHAGRVKCIYIDPPYNTRSAFEHYDDNLEHSTWLAMMWPRLELLRELLSEDGSIWVSVDDNEGHYLKIIMDEIFGRKNFVANVLWQKRIGPDSRIPLGDAHDHILVYAIDKRTFQSSVNSIPLSEQQIAQFKNPDHDPRGPWTSSSNFSAQGYRPNQMYKITTPGGKEYFPPDGRCWVTIENEFKRLLAEGRLWFGKDGRGMPRKKVYLREQSGRASWTWWGNSDVGNTQESKKESISIFGSKNSFETPKPERLIQRIIQISSNENDIVLDSFLGSASTSAVAQKMGRRYIGIEMGGHAETHCAHRMRKVVDGEQGGISRSVNWQGGGGFRFYRLGNPVFDEEGHICRDIRFPILAAHIWFSETATPWNTKAESPLLGIHDGRAYALLYNGILGDKRPNGGNVLTRPTLRIIREELAASAPDFNGPLTVYGEQSRLGDDTLTREGITFKQTPYDVKIRR